MKKVVVLDGHALNPGDLDWNQLVTYNGKAFAALTVYPRTAPEDVISRAKGAAVIVINKIEVTEAVLKALPGLQLVAVTATGVNNIDLDAARRLGIAVKNVSGYSSHAVAQHVFSLILAFRHRIERHSADVKAGGWARSPDFSYFLRPWHELNGQTMGIFGFGHIGRQVARIAQGFGMRVLAYNRSGQNHGLPVEMVDSDTLLRESDILSLHAPLTAETRHFIHTERLHQMKASALLVNTARGPLIRESDLVRALQDHVIAGACLDVMEQEPPPPDHPLYQLDNCLITPHMAWSSIEARTTLLARTAENIRSVLVEG